MSLRYEGNSIQKHSKVLVVRILLKCPK